MKTWKKSCSMIFAVVLSLSFIMMYSTIAFAESWNFVDGNSETTGINYNTAKNASSPRMVDWNGTAYVIWAEVYDTKNQIRVKKMTNGEWVTADNNTPLNKDASREATTPNLVVFNNELYAAWQEQASTNWWQLRVAKFNGTSWNRIDGDGDFGMNVNSPTNARNPKLVVYNSALYVIWDETGGDGTNKIRAKVYAGGSTWNLADGGTSLNKDNTKAAQNQEVAVYNGKLYVVWSENGSTVSQVRVKAYNGSSWSFVDGNAGTGLNVDVAVGAYIPYIAVYDNELYVAFGEKNQIRVKKYDGMSWTLVDGGTQTTGLNYNTSQNAYTPRLVAFDSNLYVAWQEGSTNQVRVKQYDGTTWTSVDGNSTKGLNRVTTNSATSVFPSVVNSSLYVTFLETSTTNQVRVVNWGPSNAAPTATNVSFTGDLKQGSTLTGTYTYGDADGDPVGVTTYKWYTATDAAGTGKTVIAGAVNNTLTLTSAEANKFIIFEVTPVASTGTPTGTPSTYTGGTAVVPNAAPTASAVSFTGTLKEGSTLNGTYTYGDTDSDLEGVTTFKWYTATDAAGTGKTAITGAVNNTLTLTSAQANKFIIFEVTPVASTGTLTGTPVTFTGATAVVPNAAPTASEAKINGTFMLTQTLTGGYNYTDADNDVESGTTFKWYAADNADGLNKTSIAGETAKTLKLKAAQFGKYIIFEVTPIAASGTAAGTPVSSLVGGPVTVLKGDANGDGVVTPADSLLATKYAQGKITLTDEQKKALDMDEDGDVDAIDSQLILNVYLGKGV
ncbi:dockerin type I domain-containing protein [Paenibacillus oryzisoli]|uniref:Dockerin domain-containing protein n=1 Tax=Paenibacillus oryzisoli TaxID=1850517 RepID=A0A198ADU4_9BACL|nr:dockerin type I domain-containing protein [Paenibacillus oryzisoli]OAS19226.1 hypothetical protein A8708_26295 [Paenibacillus oryzisoli]